MNLCTVKNKYNNLSIQTKAALWFAICNAVSKASVLLCTPIYTRILSSEQYGEYAIWHSWNGVISAFTTLNLFNSSYAAGITRYENEKEKYTASMIGLTTILSFLSFFIYTCVKTNINFQSKYVYALILEILFTAYFNFWTAYTRYYYEYIRLLYMVLFHTVCMTLGTTILPMLVLQQYRLDVRIFSEVFVWGVTGMSCLVMILQKSQGLFNRIYWQFALRQNIPLIPHYLSATILNQVDRIMIGWYCGKSKTAYYNLAYTISLMILVVTNAIKSSVEPHIYQVIKKGKDAIKLSNKINQVFIIVIYFCSISIAIAPEIIKIFAPPDYYEAIYVIPPLTTSVFYIFAYNIFSCIEFYYGKTKTIMLISCAGALVNVGLNIALIPRYGYYFAGYTTLFSYILFTLGHLRISWKVAKDKGLEGIYNIKQLFILFGIALVIMLIYIGVYDYMLFRYMILFVTSLIMMKRYLSKKILEVKRMRI